MITILYKNVLSHEKKFHFFHVNETNNMHLWYNT